MYSGEGVEAFVVVGTATYCCEEAGAGAGASEEPCRGSLAQRRLLKATPSTGATCKEHEHISTCGREPSSRLWHASREQHVVTGVERRCNICVYILEQIVKLFSLLTCQDMTDSTDDQRRVRNFVCRGQGLYAPLAGCVCWALPCIVHLGQAWWTLSPGKISLSS